MVGLRLPHGQGCHGLGVGSRTWDGAGHVAARPGTVRRMLCLDNIKIVTFLSVWGAEGSRAGFVCVRPSRSWGCVVGLGVGEDGMG